MKAQLLGIVTFGFLFAAAHTMVAQQPAVPKADASAAKTGDVSLSDLKPTPEMWFYLQERQRYDSPKLAVRRNAEIAAARRAERIAAMQWLGQSPERPNVYATVFGGHFPGTFPYGNADRWNAYYTADTVPWQWRR